MQFISYFLLNCIIGFIHAEQITTGRPREGTGQREGSTIKYSMFDYFPEEVFQHVKTKGFERIWHGKISSDFATTAKQWIEIRKQIAEYPEMRAQILKDLNLAPQAKAHLDMYLGTYNEADVKLENNTYIKDEAYNAAMKEGKLISEKQAKERRSFQGRLQASTKWVGNKINSMKSTAVKKVQSAYRAVRPVKPLVVY